KTMYDNYFFFQAEDGIRDFHVTGVRRVLFRSETLRVGNPLDKSVDIGAIVAPVQLKRIEDLVRRGQEEGATVWQPSWSCPKDGWFYPPTLLTNVAPASTVAQVERSESTRLNSSHVK